MVKNLPAVERSTKIRFGKNVPEATDQAENTIVFNASNVSFDVSNPNAVYLSPIRNRPDYTPPEVVLLMYDRNTKEITESGESANALVGGATLALTVNRSNITSNTVQFVGGGNDFNNVGFVTDSNVGISNLLPQHTVSVGSNLYIDDVGRDILVVSGNVAVLRDMVVEGNLTVNGETTIIYTENTSIRDAFIELGRNNTSADTTLDLGVLMHRPDALSNVVVGYREGTNEFAIAYTSSAPTDKTFVPKTDEDIDVHVYGRVLTEANVGIINTSPIHTLDVGSNLYVDDLASNILVVRGNVDFLGDLTVTENVYIEEDLFVTGNVYVSTNVSVTEELTVSGNVYADKDLEVLGNTYVTGNVVAYKDLLVTGNVYVSTNASVTEELSVSGNVYADKDLEVLGNTYVTGNVVAYKDLLVTGNVYVSTNASVTEELTVSGNVYADKDLEVVGNVYVDGNVVAYKDLLVTGNVYVSTNVDVSRELTVSGNVYADKDLEVLGNTYVTGNVVASKNLTLSGNAYVSGNVNVTKQLSVSGNAYVSGNVEVTKALIVSANTHLKGDNVFVTNTMRFLNPKTSIVTDQVSNVQIRLGQLENVSNTASNPLNDQVLLYEGGKWSNLYPNHSFLTIKNDSVYTMVAGNAVYVSGYQNQNLALVKLAKADSAATMPSIGIVYSTSIAPGGEGLAAAYGKVNQMNTNGYQVGETLYVSNLYAGWISNVKPYYTDSSADLIQNIGVVTRRDTNSGAMFVTGIGRANDVPNARIETSNASVNYVYVNSINNDFRKIDPMKLPTKLQPLTHVVNTGNTAANAVTLRGVSITSGDGFHGDLVVAGNVTVDTTTFHVDAETNRMGLGTTTPKATLHTVGNVFVTSNIVTNSNVIVLGIAAASSKTTGALQVTGGVGVQGDIYATNTNFEDVEADSVTVTDATAASSKTTGALQVVGGVGVQGDIYATNTNFEDVEADSVTVTDATAATNTTTGALKVAGGVGIQGDLHVTNGTFTTNVYITNHTDLNNKYLAMIDTNGSLIQSPVYVAPSGKYVITASEAEFLGNITLGGNTTLLTSTSLIVEDRIIGIGSNNSVEGLDSGIIIEHQDEGTFANIALIHHANEHRFSIGYTQNTLTDNHILNASHPNNVTLRIDLIGNAIVQNCLSVADMGTFGTKVGIATTEPIANIHVVGNVFATSNITTSSNIIVTGDAASTSKTTGALQVVGGVGVQGDIYATHANLEDVEADSVNITDTTTSTTTTSGALKVAGGVSTQENLNVGGITKIWDSTVVTGKTDGALIVVGGVGISGDIHATHCNFEDVEADSVNITDTTTSTSTTTGALKVAGGVSTQEKLNVGGITKIWDSTVVTGKTDGALIVVGGVGISGDIHATHCNFEDVEADSVNITDATASTGKTDGALVVAGGVGISGALYGAAATFDGVTSVTNATAVTSKTDGALVVTGGVGISGDIHATHANLEDVEADSVTVTDATQATSTTTGALTVVGGISTQTNVHAANVYISGGLITNTAGVTKKTYSYSGTIGDTEQPHINVCFTNHSFNAKVTAQLIEGDDEISVISFECCGGNKAGTFPASAIQKGSVQVFGPASTNPWNVAVVTDQTTVALKPSAAIDTSGEYHIFVEYTTAKAAGAVANVVQDTTEKIVFGY